MAMMVPAAVATMAAAMHSVTAAAVHSVTTAAVTAMAAHGAGRRGSQHGKAERSTRDDGQKCGFTKHDSLL